MSSVSNETSILYLATNHISALIRDPDAEASQAVLGILKSRQVVLAMTMMLLIELFNPTFARRAAVGEMLDRLPLTSRL